VKETTQSDLLCARTRRPQLSQKRVQGLSQATTSTLVNKARPLSNRLASFTSTPIALLSLANPKLAHNQQTQLQFFLAKTHSSYLSQEATKVQSNLLRQKPARPPIMNPHQNNKVDINVRSPSAAAIHTSRLIISPQAMSPDEQRLFRMYGKLPDKKNLLQNKLKVFPFLPLHPLLHTQLTQTRKTGSRAQILRQRRLRPQQSRQSRRRRRHQHRRRTPLSRHHPPPLLVTVHPNPWKPQRQPRLESPAHTKPFVVCVWQSRQGRQYSAEGNECRRSRW
jgi:hypothetical protein